MCHKKVNKFYSFLTHIDVIINIYGKIYPHILLAFIWISNDIFVQKKAIKSIQDQMLQCNMSFFLLPPPKKKFNSSDYDIWTFFNLETVSGVGRIYILFTSCLI